MGFLLLMMLGVGVAANLLMSSEDDDGATAEDNSTSDEPEDRNINLASGVQNPSGGAGNDKFTGIVEGTVRGAAGNDTFSFEDGYAAKIYGGAGEDSFVGGMGDSFTLHGDAGNDSFSFDTDVFDGAAAYGGTGDDRFDLHFDDSDNQRGAILSGGDGADTYDLTFAPGMAAKAGPGKLVTITDFDPAEDGLDIDFNQLDRAELVENREGNYSDLNLHYTATDDTGAAVDRHMRIRLQGVTGSTLEDLGIALPDTDGDTGRLYEIASGGLSRVDGGTGDDTIRGIADGSFFGGSGNDAFEIETGADSTLDGGSGDDVMTIGEGVNFTIRGGAGDDALYIDATRNTQEASIIDGGDGDDRINVDITLTDPSGQRIDTVSGGAGFDTFTLNLTGVTYGRDYASDQMLAIKDLTSSEDDLVINIPAQDAPFYKGATLVPNAQDGSTNLVLTFEKADSNGTLRQWTGIITLLDTRDLVLAQDGPIQIRTAA